jgi:rRNA-processing protein FCF1
MVLLDSSALLAPFETGVDFINGITGLTQGRTLFLIPFETLIELKRLSINGPRLSGMARLALSVASSFRTLLPTGMSCDDALVYLAKTYKAGVATADRTLSRRLRALGIPVFYPSGGRRIVGKGWFEKG